MKKINLHLGCGSVYLRDWLNVDVYQKGYTYLASERKDLMEHNATDLGNYYKYPYGKKINFVVVDNYWDMTEIPYPFKDDSVNKILTVQAFEHFSKTEGTVLMKEWYRILAKGGELLIDIPDLIGTSKLLKGTNPDWAIRLIYGSQKDKYSFHKWGYTFETLSKLCEDIGFIKVEKANLIKHDYPAFMVRAIK